MQKIWQCRWSPTIRYCIFYNFMIIWNIWVILVQKKLRKNLVKYIRENLIIIKDFKKDIRLLLHRKLIKKLENILKESVIVHILKVTGRVVRLTILKRKLKSEIILFVKNVVLVIKKSCKLTTLNQNLFFQNYMKF